MCRLQDYTIHRIITFFDTPFQGDFGISCHLNVYPKTTIQLLSQVVDFKFELFPLHSPLLGKSLLVSFPPLINMLKFGGYSYLI